MYFVTFSGMMGTHAEEIAKKVAHDLGYSFFGEEELFKAANEMGFLADVKTLDEKGPTLPERLFSEKPRLYLDRLQSVIYDLAKNGNGVFFGRGSQLLLHSFDCALHVLIVGSEEKRLSRIMEEKKVGREVAEKVLEKSDHDKKGFLRYAFGEDWLNPHLYDVILNIDKLSVDSAAKMVIDAARSEEIKSCGIDSLMELGKLALHRKVESVLLEAGLSSPYLFVTVENADSVRLFGIVSSPEEKKMTEKMVRKIKDVKNLINDLQVAVTPMAAV
jgi:cytidylate kinase